MKPIRTLGVLSAMSFLALTAFAASPPPAGNLRRACRQDVMTLCQGVKLGGGAIAQCMRKNYRKLSSGCKAAIRARRRQKAAATSPSS